MFRKLSLPQFWKNKLHQELFQCFLYFGGAPCGLIWSDLYLKALAFLEMEEFYCTVLLSLLTRVQSSNFYTIWLLNSCLLIFSIKQDSHPFCSCSIWPSWPSWISCFLQASFYSTESLNIWGWGWGCGCQGWEAVKYCGAGNCSLCIFSSCQ